MNPVNCILAATDLSAPARHAVERAGRLAAHTGDELHILHALESTALDALRDLLGANRSSAAAELETDAHARLAMLGDALARERGVAAIARVVKGGPLEVIAHEADALDARLVVLGAHGESFLRHAMLGSTASRLLRKSARRPVLVVRKAPHGDYRTILVALDFSPVSRQLVEATRRWAHEADIVLLHAFELPYEGMLSRVGIEQNEILRLIDEEMQKRRNRLHELAADAGLASVDYMARVLHGDPSQQIIAMEQEYHADVIAVGKHGAHITDELLLGSVTRHVLAEAQGDVLVVSGPQPDIDARR